MKALLLAALLALGLSGAAGAGGIPVEVYWAEEVDVDIYTRFYVDSYDTLEFHQPPCLTCISNTHYRWYINGYNDDGNCKPENGASSIIVACIPPPHDDYWYKPFGKINYPPNPAYCIEIVPCDVE